MTRDGLASEADDLPIPVQKALDESRAEGVHDHGLPRLKSGLLAAWASIAERWPDPAPTFAGFWERLLATARSPSIRSCPAFLIRSFENGQAGSLLRTVIAQGEPKASEATRPALGPNRNSLANAIAFLSLPPDSPEGRRHAGQRSYYERLLRREHLTLADAEGMFSADEVERIRAWIRRYLPFDKLDDRT